MFSDRFHSGFLLLLLVLGACSIREDRSESPSLVILDCSCVDTGVLSKTGCDELSWVLSTGDFRREGRFPADELPAEYVVETPRTEASLLVTAGDDGRFDPDAGLVIPEGESCPPLFASRTAVDATLPEVRVPVILYKRHVHLEIRLRDLMQQGLGYAVLGSVCGYGPDLEPLPGAFRVPLSQDGTGRCHIVVPAQTDGSLTLCVYRYGELDSVFSIGE